MPVVAGFAVAWLQGLGFSPALKVLTRAMEGVTDDASKASTPKSYWQVRSGSSGRGWVETRPRGGPVVARTLGTGSAKPTGAHEGCRVSRPRLAGVGGPVRVNQHSKTRTVWCAHRPNILASEQRSHAL